MSKNDSVADEGGVQIEVSVKDVAARTMQHGEYATIARDWRAGNSSTGSSLDQVKANLMSLQMS